MLLDHQIIHSHSFTLSSSTDKIIFISVIKEKLFDGLDMENKQFAHKNCHK